MTDEPYAPGSGQSITEFLIERLTLDNARLTSAHASATAEWAEMHRKYQSIRATLRAVIETAKSEPPAGMDQHTHNQAKIEAIRRMAQAELERK